METEKQPSIIETLLSALVVLIIIFIAWIGVEWVNPVNRILGYFLFLFIGVAEICVIAAIMVLVFYIKEKNKCKGH